MAKRNYYYVLVATKNGGQFVTSIDHKEKTAKWDRKEKPLEMGKQEAENIAFGLKMNFYWAIVVYNEFDIDKQIFYRENKESEVK